jgi:hypothetical protein
MFANDLNVLITDVGVGAVLNTGDQLIIELEYWFERYDFVINVG